MLNKLTSAIDNTGYLYTLVTLNRVDIEFTDFTAAIVIRDDKYVVHIFEDGSLVDHEEYKYPKNCLNYIVRIWNLYQENK